MGFFTRLHWAGVAGDGLARQDDWPASSVFAFDHGDDVDEEVDDEGVDDEGVEDDRVLDVGNEVNE